MSDIGVSYNFLATGEIIRDGHLFDSFRYQYNLPATQLKTETIPLVFERYLRPGEYELALRVDDLNAEKSHRVLVDLDVPRVEHLRPPEPADPETARLLAEANAAITSGDNTIKIVEPRGRYQTGMLTDRHHDHRQGHQLGRFHPRRTRAAHQASATFHR